MSNRNTKAAAALRRHLNVLKLGTGALALAVASSWAVPAIAQQTTSSMTGLILTQQGEPATGVQVEVVHTPSGTRSTATVNAEGRFSAAGLRVGGPYTVRFSGPNIPTQAVEGIFVTLGETFALDLVLEGRQAGQAVEEIIVTGERTAGLQTGSGVSFGEEILRRAPTITNDLKDIARFDPKVFIDTLDNRGVDPISIAGTNSRFNSLTVDGVRQNDDFGLNDTGYATQRSPISLDAVEQLQILTAPFSVEYAGFQGGTINVVTKSGTNEFSGSAFYYYTDNDLVGDETRGRTVTVDEFKEESYGGTLGGPIIKDTLFFFLSYEKFETDEILVRCPAGNTCLNQTPRVTQANYDRIRNISQSVYGYDPGAFTGGYPVLDEKWLAKLDWNITDDHRATVTYQRAETSDVTQTSAAFGGASNGVAAPSNFYTTEDNLANAYSIQVFSDWTSNFSTELKYARKENERFQDPLGGRSFAEAHISIPGQLGGTGGVTIGPDRFRHLNSLTNDLDQFKVKGQYLWGDHTFTFGWERQDLEIFNAFVAFSLAQWQFASIEDFQARRASAVDYRNAFTNNSNDAAASFGYSIDSVYFQDEWDVTEDLTIQAGLRYDWFSSDDRPRENANFIRRYGFTNTETLDGRDLLQPRFGFNWNVADRTTIRGGVGLFGGGTPNVWVSNSYSNDGVIYVSTAINRATATPAQLAVLDNANLSTVPALLQQQLAAARGDGPVNALDPDFDIPSTWRYSLALDQSFDIDGSGNDLELTAEIVYSAVESAVVWRDARLLQIGTTADGRPRYGQRGAAQGDTRTASAQDLILGTTDRGYSLVLAFSANKTWETNFGDFDAYAGYAYTDAKDVNPGTSSTASSNFEEQVTDDINNPDLATSNYEIRHRFTWATAWSEAFFGDFETTVSLFGEHRSGRPYSFRYDDPGTVPAGLQRVQPGLTARGQDRQLFYVPSGPTDPRVRYTGGASYNALLPVLQGTGLDRWAGETAPRNAFQSPWVHTVDLKLSQEIPGFLEGHKGKVEFDIRNFLNFINSSWGRQEAVGFSYSVPIVDAVFDPVTGQYVYSNIRQNPVEDQQLIAARRSIWQMRLGVRYEF